MKWERNVQEEKEDGEKCRRSLQSTSSVWVHLDIDPNDAVLLEPQDKVTITRVLCEVSSMTKYTSGQEQCDRIVCRKEGGEVSRTCSKRRRRRRG